MKRPNITPGKWSHGLDATHPYSPLAVVYQTETGAPIADVEPILDGPEFNDDIIANTKAISAVPDMIDALMELNGSLESLTYTYRDYDIINNNIETIRKALIKAGLEL